MPEGRIKVACVLPSFAGGGAEKVMLTLLERFPRDRFEPIVVVFENKGQHIDSIPKDLKVINLKKKNKLDFFGLIGRFSGTLKQERPAVILSFLWYANAVSVLGKHRSHMDIPVALSVRTYMSMALKDENWKFAKRLMIRNIYPKADLVLTVSRAMGEDMVNNFNVKSSQIKVIPNPVDIDRIRSLAEEKVKHHWFDDSVPVIISVGRLNRQKGFPVLLKAFARLVRERQAKLIILGEGEERPAIEALVSRLGIGDSVSLPGFVKNPYAYIKRSSVFVMSSLYEGFPNALVEAMACSTPVISTACPSGPDEIINDGVNGLLVPVEDEQGLYRAISKILSDRDFAQRLGANGGNDVRRYKVERIMGEYEKMLSSLAGGADAVV